MTAEELNERKENLEDAVKELLQAFERDTGFSVDEIKIERVSVKTIADTRDRRLTTGVSVMGNLSKSLREIDRCMARIG